MASVPTAKDTKSSPTVACRPCCSSCNALTLAAGGTLLGAVALLLTGRKRTGAVVAATGAALALLDQEEMVKGWWRALPGVIDDTQQVLNKVQDAVHEAAVRRERLEQIFRG